MSKPLVFSYTSLKTADPNDGCPYKFKRMYLDNAFAWDAQGAEQRKGSEVHKQFARALTSGLDMPHSLRDLNWVLRRVRMFIRYDDPTTYKGLRSTLLPEWKAGIDKNMRPVGFFDDGVKFRGAADLVIVNDDRAVIFDYKTGNVAYADMDQIDMMALLVFTHMPTVQHIEGGLLFTKAKPSEQHEMREYSRQHDLPVLRKWLAGKFMDLADRKSRDDWPANKSGLCKAHCPVLDCTHNGRMSK